MSELFAGLKANIQGGIGSQIIRVMACAGEAIENGVKPNNIYININKYRTDIPKDKDLIYHNTADIEEYINTRINFRVVDDYIETPQKSYKFDAKMLQYCKAWHSCAYNHDYLSLNSKVSPNPHFPRDSHVLWIRGKDRYSHLPIFEKIVESLSAKSLIFVLSNDPDLINKSDILNKFYAKSSSLSDFQPLTTARNVYTQLSGFSISAYLLSSEKQTLHLIDKKYHEKECFPFIDKDWLFFNTLLCDIKNANNGKGFNIIN